MSGSNIRTLFSNFPGGFANGVTVRGVPVVNSYSGLVFWVDSNHGSDGNAGTFDRPFATLGYAISKCTADRGDIVFLKSGHAETYSTAAAVTVAIAAVNVVGLGSGADRPTFTFATSTAATFIVNAANFSMQNVVMTTTVDQIVSPVVVQAADCYLDFEWQDGASNKEALRAVLTTAAATRLTCNLTYRGFTAGTHGVNAVRLVGVNHATINMNYYGKASTAVVEFLTTACVDVNVSGYMYNASVTDGSKNVVDTVTGSTWYASFTDGSAGATFAGGSAVALSKADLSAIEALFNVPTADATTNATVRDVVGNKTDTGVTAVGTTKSIAAYAKGLVTMLTVQAQDSTNNAFAGDVTGNKTDTGVTAVGTTKSLMAYIKGAITMLTVQAANSANNAFAGDVVGNKTDTAVYNPGTTASLLAYLKGATDLQEQALSNTAAVMANGTSTLWTIAGGPIEIFELFGICVTGNDATATTVKFNINATNGGSTDVSAASASLANATAGTSILCTGTFASATTVTAGGTVAGGTTKFIAPAGTIRIITATGPTTGTWQFFIRFRPCAKGVTVS